MKTKRLDDLIKEIERTLIPIANKQRRCFYEENRILTIVGEDLEAEPRQYAKIYDERYGETIKGEIMTGNYVIGVLRACILAHINERKHIYTRALFYAQTIVDVLSGKGANIDCLSKMETEVDDRDLKKFKRITLLYLANLSPEIKNSDVYKPLLKLNKDFAAECFDAMVEIIVDFCSDDQDDIDEYKQQILTYERKLKNANRTIELLEEDFEQDLEQSVAEERKMLMAMLNSQKYGYLIDALSQSQKMFREMRKNKVEIPSEFKQVQNITKNMMKFIADCEITPIMEIGDILTINCFDTEKYAYEGSSFKDDNETKQVEVISSGWEIKSKDMVISNPRVVECEEE